MSKISVVTVMFNPSLEQLEATVNSVINQDFSDFEYILQDGGSDNKLLFDYLQGITEKYSFVKFFSKEDRSIYEGMNNAVKNSNGDYLLFVNVGDLIFSDSVLSDISRELSSEYAIIASRYVAYGEDIDGASLLPQKKLNMLFITNLCHQTYFLKRDLIAFDTNYKLAADFKLLWDIFSVNHNDIKYVDYPVCFYLSGGVSDVGVRQVYWETIKAILYNKQIPLLLKLTNIIFYVLRLLRSCI
ncbi:MAG: glycosyltransferase [Shewanella sp.]